MNFTKACWKTTFWRIADNIIKGAALAALIFLTACDKPKDFTLKTTSPAGHFNVKDTILPVFLETEILDSLRTNNLSADIAGSLYDPELGITDAQVFFNIQLQNLVLNVPVTPRVDSAFLYLTYADPANTTQVGDLSVKQSWNFYPLQGVIDNSIPYYSNTTQIQPNKNILLANYTGSFRVGDSTLKIPFSKSYAARMLNSGQTALSDNITFQDSFPGIALIPDHTALNGNIGALINLNLSDLRTRVVVFYTDGSGAKDTFTCNVSDAAMRIGAYKHIYDTKNVIPILNKINQSKAYLQALAGLKVKVTLPNLDSFMVNGTTSINQAELVFPEYATPISFFPEPTQLLLYPRSIDGTNETLNANYNQGFIDQTFPEYGGLWRPTEKSYAFVMTRHIQNVLDRYRITPNYNQPGGLRYEGMNLYIPSDNPLSGRRLILKPTNLKDPKSGPYMHLIYTKIPQH